MKKTSIFFAVSILALQASAQWQNGTPSTNIYYSAGNVGIGTTTPEFSLDVNGFLRTRYFICDAPAIGEIAGAFRGATNGSANVVLQGGGGQAYWMSGTNGILKLGGNGGSEPSKGAINIDYLGNVAVNSVQDFGEKFNVNGNIHVGDFTTGIYNSGANALIRVNERLTFQSTVNSNNDWSRGALAQNIQWNNTSQQWDIPSSTSDFAMWKYESNGNISLYTNTNTSSPYSLTEANLKAYQRIWVTGDGRVCIGNVNPGTFRLAVDGKVAAREVKVTLQSPFPDYVFAGDYNLMSLDSLETFIKKNNRLPNIPSAQEVKDNEGIELGEMNRKLLEKIEELTLYMIELKKENKEMQKKLSQLSQEKH